MKGCAAPDRRGSQPNYNLKDMQTFQPKIEILYISIFGLLGGFFVVWLTGTLQVTSGSFWTSIVIIATAVLVWTFRGGKHWWMAFAVMTSLGGVFWVGFKIYPSEIGLLLAVAALFFTIVIKRKKMGQGRPKISWAFNLLIIYFILHMLASLYAVKTGLTTGAGSIIRTYSTGMTFLVFGWLFYKFGQTKYIKNVFIITLIINSIRMGFGLYAYFFPYTPSFSEPGWTFMDMAGDLRTSALYQIYAGIIVFHINSNRIFKIGIILLLALSFVFLLLGQGRVSVLAAILTIALWLMIDKRYGVLVIILSIFLSLFILINTNAKLFEALPFEARRSLSFAVLDKNKISFYPFDSDEWHFDLFKSGFDKWSNSTYSLFLGNLIDPSDVWRFDSLNFYYKLQIASAMARYESSLWMTLATLGLFGFFLYFVVFRFLFRDVVSAVIRDGIIDFNHAVYLVAFIVLLLMILLGWIRGGFPGYEIMLGVMGKALYEDSKRDQSIRRIRVLQKRSRIMKGED